MYVQLNEENRIIGTSDINCFPEDTIVIEFEFDIDFDFDNQYEYLIKDNQLIPAESDDSKRFREEAEHAQSTERMIAEQDDAICALYEENLAIKQTASDQDDAICYLYEQLLKEGDNNGN